MGKLLSSVGIITFLHCGLFLDGSRAEPAAEMHFSMGLAYSSNGETDHAIEEFKIALIYDSGSAVIHSRLASEYVKKGLLSSAMDSCKHAIRINPKAVETRMMLAGLYASLHDRVAAIDQYENVLKFDSKNEEAVVYLSQILAENNDALQAKKRLYQFNKTCSDCALSRFFLGRIEQQQGHLQEAILAYRKAMEIKPGFSQAALALGYLYEDTQRMPQAIVIYKTLFAKSQDSNAANRLALIYLKAEKYEQALPYLKFLEEVDPDDLNNRVKLGLVYIELKQYQKAVELFQILAQKSPDSDRVHYYLGSLYEELKQVESAIDQFKLIKPASKLYADAVLHSAFLMKEKKQVEEAKNWVKEGIKNSPKAASLYVFQASLEEESKNVNNAIEILKRGASEVETDEKIRYYLGSLYDRQGEVDKGMEQMEAILKLNPNNVDALNYLGYTWTVKGVRLADAERLIRKALSLRPESGFIQDSWGWYLLARGRISEAIKQLEKAARLKPNEPTILEHLGDAYLRSNLREKASSQYRDALKFSQDEESRKKIESKLEGLRQNEESLSSERLPAAEKNDRMSQ